MKALVLSGGGARGAVHVGMVRHLVRDLGIDYDIVAGISVGALNAVALASAPRGDMTAGYEKLVDVWKSISGNRDIWQHWCIPYLPGLVWRDSFYNAKPLMELLEATVDQAAIKNSGRKLRLGCVEYGSGTYVDADENTPELWKWAYGSAAFPAFFQPMAVGGELLMDGGARRITPLKAAIEAGADEVDVLLAHPVGADIKESRENWLGTKITGLKVALRAIDLQSVELFERDLMLCQLHNRFIQETGHGMDATKRLVNVRVFSPAASFASGALKFDPSDIDARMEHGYEIAKRVALE